MPGIGKRNDYLLYALGVHDDLDPVNTNGTKKYINDCTITYEILDGPVGTGSVIASGSGALVVTGPLANAGNYYIELDRDIAYTVGGYYHIVGENGDGFRFDLEDTLEAGIRTGRTLIT